MLSEILSQSAAAQPFANLLVGSANNDDAAVYRINDTQAIVATTDFFMPIVDDPYNFGRIASANAISDVYAMGGDPIMAIAILGWPINILSPLVARRVIEGSRSICREAGIPLAGGHSIDSPEPIFGLAVNGLVDIKNLKQNNTAQRGDLLLLTKKIGVGILTTAEKKNLLKKGDESLAAEQMMQLNKIGAIMGKIDGVHAMTDVTGFGLMGHLIEMVEGSGLSAKINFSAVPLISDRLVEYIEMGSVPGGTNRNWDSYGHKVHFGNIQHRVLQKNILADPQTSGGLLIAVSKDALQDVIEQLKHYGLSDSITPIGEITASEDFAVSVY